MLSRDQLRGRSGRLCGVLVPVFWLDCGVPGEVLSCDVERRCGGAARGMASGCGAESDAMQQSDVIMLVASGANETGQQKAAVHTKVSWSHSTYRAAEEAGLLVRMSSH